MSKENLIKKLNEDLAYELSAIVQYITYSAKVSGPYRPQLKAFFEQEIPDEQGHALFLANKIVQMGGEPVTKPMPVPEASTAREMLEAVMAAETKALEGYKERASQAEEAGEKGLAISLEDMIVDETGHREEVQRILQDWPL